MVEKLTAKKRRHIAHLQSDKPISIYALVDPRDNTMRYVGYTATPSIRLTAHLIEARHAKRPNRRMAWINQLVAMGLKPEMRILESVSIEDATGRERYWMDTLRESGCELLNAIRNYGVNAYYKNLVSRVDQLTDKGRNDPAESEMSE